MCGRPSASCGGGLVHQGGIEGGSLRHRTVLPIGHRRDGGALGRVVVGGNEQGPDHQLDGPIPLVCRIEGQLDRRPSEEAARTGGDVVLLDLSQLILSK